MEKVNEKLRGLLKTCLDIGELPTLTRGRIEAALSQQAEPCEPAEAQDERVRLLARCLEVAAGFDSRLCKDIEAAIVAEARPAQTEQQPVAWMYRGTNMGDQLSFQCLNHYWRPKFGGAEHEYVAGIPLYTAPIAQTAPQPEYDDTALFDALYKGQVAAEKAGMANGTTQWGLCLLRHIRAALSAQGGEQ